MVDTTAEDFDYETSKKLFKATARNKTKEMLDAYWKNLFDCDYLLYVEKVLGKSGDDLSGKANVSFIPKKNPPKWDESKISFTKDLSTWNESCTLKYDGVSIGEWQVHNNRDCFKFRFIMSGLKKAGLI